LSKKKIVVLGAGPAGLSAALSLLQSDNCSVIVVEKESAVGGLSKSFDLWGKKVDLGPHRFFSPDSRVNKWWSDRLKGHYVLVNRLTRIFYKDKFFYYPLKLLNVLAQLGFFESIAIFFSYVKVRIFPLRTIQSFEEWVVSKFGRRLFNIFFKSYSEKLWGLPCSTIDLDFAAQRIKKLTMLEILKDLLGGGLNRKKHKTLVDQFVYPEKGAGQVYDNMKSEIVARGGTFVFDTVPCQIEIEGQVIKSISLSNGQLIQCDELISSIPITDLFKLFNITDEKLANSIQQLSYRNTVLVYLKIAQKSIFADQWIYVHVPEIHAGRITNFENWVSRVGDGFSTLVFEYWCNSQDKEWNESDSYYIEMAKQDASHLGLFSVDKIEDNLVVRIEKSYPIYKKGYRQPLSDLIAFSHRISNLQLIGRNGCFKYNNQDHSILMGILAAENILSEKQINLWNVNEGDEYHESAQVNYEESRSV